MNEKKNLWSFQLNTASLVLIPAAVGINYIGKLFAGLLKLPLWLDSIGTMLAAFLAGPVVGALSGLINNVIYGLTMDPISFVYALTNVGIGIAVGLLARSGKIRGVKSAILGGVVVALVAVVISTPLNMIFWGGQTGNVWGDAVYAWCVAQGMPALVGSALDEVVVDLPDKIATILIAYGIFRGLPKKLTLLCQSGEKVESLD